MAAWRLLSNHGRVLVFIGREPTARLRDIAQAVDLTERSVHRIVSELCDDGYLTRISNGRTNHYQIQPDVPVHDPLLGDHWVGEILAVVAGKSAWREARTTRPDGDLQRRGGDPKNAEQAEVPRGGTKGMAGRAG